MSDTMAGLEDKAHNYLSEIIAKVSKVGECIVEAHEVWRREGEKQKQEITKLELHKDSLRQQVQTLREFILPARERERDEALDRSARQATIISELQLEILKLKKDLAKADSNEPADPVIYVSMRKELPVVWSNPPDREKIRELELKLVQANAMREAELEKRLGLEQKLEHLQQRFDDFLRV